MQLLMAGAGAGVLGRIVSVASSSRIDTKPATGKGADIANREGSSRGFEQTS